MMEHLNEKVKELRKKKGWAQEDLAREICVSLSTVQRWEKQGAKPSRPCPPGDNEAFPGSWNQR